MDVAMTATWVSAMAARGVIHAALMTPPGYAPSSARLRAGSDALAGRARRRARVGRAPDRPNGVGLTVDVGEEGGIRGPPQSLFDQRPEHDLQAHRQFHGHGGPAGQGAGPVDQIARQDDEDTALVFEHAAIHI